MDVVVCGVVAGLFVCCRGGREGVVELLCVSSRGGGRFAEMMLVCVFLRVGRVFFFMAFIQEEAPA